MDRPMPRCIIAAKRATHKATTHKFVILTLSEPKRKDLLFVSVILLPD